MSSSGEEEEAGPSVDSNDPEERIAARRLRIQRRLEMQKKYVGFRNISVYVITLKSTCYWNGMRYFEK